MENFKALRGRHEIPLAPLTLIYGTNSAGKSSIIQSLVLLSQSFTPPDGVPAAFREDRLVLRGDLVDLGSFDAVVSNHNRDLRVGIGARVDPIRRPSTISDLKPSEGTILFFKWDGFSSEIRTSGAEILLDGASIPVEKTSTPFDSSPDYARPDTGYKASPEHTVDLLNYLNAGGVRLQIDEKSHWQAYFSGVLADSLVGFQAGANSKRVGELLAGESKRSRREEAKGAAAFQQYQAVMRRTTTRLLSSSLGPALSRVRYLGPLRQPPERLNILSGTRPRWVGAHGEDVVDVLARRSNVIDSVNQWFERLDIPYSLKVQRVDTHELSGAVGDIHCVLLQERDTRIEVSPADVGFGIGQVLPVILQSVLGNEQVLCIEQPELHLHPGLQSRLADLFASTVRNGSEQFILETHSEHLVLRLQRLIRRGELRPDDVCVLYVSRSPVGEGSVVQRMRLNETGEFIDEWPSGFFDERLDEIFGE